MIKRILVVAAFALLMLVPAPVLAQAVLTAEKTAEIRRNCSSAQINLRQLQKRDAVSRINRGRAYDQLLRQVSALNSRFAFNRIDAPQFVQLANDLQTTVNTFRATYTRYDDHVTNAIKINCKESTAQFYDLIIQARQERQTLGQDVMRVDALALRYRERLVDYQQTLLRDTPPERQAQ